MVGTTDIINRPTYLNLPKKTNLQTQKSLSYSDICAQIDQIFPKRNRVKKQTNLSPSVPNVNIMTPKPPQSPVIVVNLAPLAPLAPNPFSVQVKPEKVKKKRKSELQGLSKYLDKKIIKKKIQELANAHVESKIQRKSCSMDDLRSIENKLNELTEKHEQLVKFVVESNPKMDRKKSVSAQNLTYDPDDPKTLLHKSIKQRLNDKLKYISNDNVVKRNPEPKYVDILFSLPQMQRSVSMNDIPTLKSLSESNKTSKSLSSISLTSDHSHGSLKNYHTIHAGMKLPPEFMEWSLLRKRYRSSMESLVSIASLDEDLICQIDRVKIPFSKCVKLKNKKYRLRRLQRKHFTVVSTKRLLDTFTSNSSCLDTKIIQHNHQTNNALPTTKSNRVRFL